MAMSDDTSTDRPFQVGDTIRYGTTGDIWKVTDMDDLEFVIHRDGEGFEVEAWHAASAYERVPSFPEQWINVYPQGGGYGRAFYSREEADAMSAPERVGQPARIGVVHLAADGTLTMEQL